jgi:uncharacterized protein (DUF433 family)
MSLFSYFYHAVIMEFFMLEFERITFDQRVMGGKACIRGLRVTVSLVINLVANGMSTAEIIEAYPYLEPDDIHQALRFAAWLAEETVHPVELASLPPQVNKG